MTEKNTDVFDLNGIRRLVELMKENAVCELDFEQNGSRLTLRRSPDAFGEPTVLAQPHVAPAPAPRVAAQTPPEPQPPRDAQKDAANVAYIKSPMVGTFYAAPSPDAPPFVSPGDSVTPEKTVCIIEAMKIFNDVPADLSGVIVEALVKTGDPVEFGTPLFKVETR